MLKKIGSAFFSFANIPIIKSIRTGLLSITPFLIIGSMMLAILDLPVKSIQAFLDAFLGEHWRDTATLIHKGTLQIMSVTALISISFSAANEHESIKSGELSPVSIVITALASYIVFIYEPEGILGQPNSGSTALFTSLFVSTISTALFLALYTLRNTLYPVNPVKYNGNALVRLTFRVILPAFLCILFFAILKTALEALHIREIIGGLPFRIYKNLLSLNNYLSIFVLILSTHLFWMLGIHGGNFIMDRIPDILINMRTLPGGEMELHVKRMLDIFVHLGGAGATFGLLLSLLLVGKRHNENLLAKSSFIPGVFNINESIIFGLPVIYNPYFLIPFMAAPLAISAVSYFAFWSGMVPPINNQVMWTTPVFLSGYLATGSVMGAVLQGMNLAVSIAIYAPFIRMQQKNQDLQRQLLLKKLNRDIQNRREIQANVILNRNDDIGGLARELAEEIKNALRTASDFLYMEYQPKVDYTGRVLGAEALLRCRHPFFGNLPPNVVLYLAEEAGLLMRLGAWSFNQAFSDLGTWHGAGFRTISLSANLNPKQLQEDDGLIQALGDCIQRNRLDPSFMELEITENAAIDPSALSRSRLGDLKSMGITLSIDDFGMGHSSLLYLADSFAGVVKIDRSLVMEIAHDADRRHIVHSIISLCKRLNVGVIAEGVEKKEQIDVLQGLGCRYYQGYYFSKSLRSGDFLEYVKRNGTVFNTRDEKINAEEP